MSDREWRDAGMYPNPDDPGLCSLSFIHRAFEPLSREMMPPCIDCLTDKGEGVLCVDLDLELIERAYPDGPGLSRQDLHCG